MTSQSPGSRSGSFRRFFIGVCFVLAAAVEAQVTPDTIEVTGEASVVIFDDFERGRSETRYFIRDLAKGRDMELFFAKGAPEGFVTGRQFNISGRGRPDGIEVDSLTAMADGGETGGGETVSAPVASPETRKVLTILVDFNDALVDNGSSNGISLQEAKDRMFNENKNVAHFFNTASLGTWTIPDDVDGDGSQDVYGPYKINYDYMNSTCSYTSWVTAARNAWEAANPGRSFTEYRHTSLIVPNYWDYPASQGRSCGWGGIAQLGCGTTCWAISADPRSIVHGVLIHELGHNFSLHHASTDTDNDGAINSEYGDGSDMMGSSRSWMKFNAPHADDKGWVDPVNYEVRTVVPSASAQEFDLLPMDAEAATWPGLRALKIERDASSDYYVSYRIATGHYNNVNSGYRNELSIHYGKDGSTRSYYVTGLATGQTYNDPHNGLIITATGELDIGGITVMGVQLCQDSCSSLPAPSGLTATANGTGAIDLSWTDNAGAVDGFTLQHSSDGSSWGLEADNLLTTSYADTGLATASTHYYRVRAFYGAEISGWSNVASATTDAIAPTAFFSWSNDFTEVTFNDGSSDSDGSVVGWSWHFGDSNSSSLQNPVHTYASAGTYTVSLTVTDNHGATDTWVDNTVTVDEPPFTDHFAQSESTAGGSVSGSLSLTFDDDGAAEILTERESGGKPSSRHSWLEHQWNFVIPVGASATVMANAWQDDTGEGDAFNFEYSANGGAWGPLFTVAGGDVNAAYSATLVGVSGSVAIRVTDTDQTPQNRAFDRLHVDELLIRVASGVGGDGPDATPVLTGANPTGHDQVDLSWTESSSNEDGFRIERRVQGEGSWVAAGSVGANATAFSDTGLSGNTTYEYQVVAFNIYGDSAASNMLSATTDDPPAVEIALTVAPEKDKGKHWPRLSWTPANSMDVYFNDNESVPLQSSVESGWVHQTSNKGGATYKYQVCQSGGRTACSGWVEVTY